MIYGKGNEEKDHFVYIHSICTEESCLIELKIPVINNELDGIIKSRQLQFREAASTRGNFNSLTIDSIKIEAWKADST